MAHISNAEYLKQNLLYAALEIFLELWFGFFLKLKVSNMTTEIDQITPLVKDRTSGIGLIKFKSFKEAVKGQSAAKVQDILFTT